VIQAARHDYEVHAFSRRDPGISLPNVHWHHFDALDDGALASHLSDVRPDAVVHAAAIAAIDYCKAHKDEAWTVNVEFTRRLAEHCSNLGAKLVFVSTDNVFDGEGGNYREQDQTNPLNYYGRTPAPALLGCALGPSGRSFGNGLHAATPARQPRALFAHKTLIFRIVVEN